MCLWNYGLDCWFNIPLHVHRVVLLWNTTVMIYISTIDESYEDTIDSYKYDIYRLKSKLYDVNQQLSSVESVLGGNKRTIRSRHRSEKLSVRAPLGVSLSHSHHANISLLLYFITTLLMVRSTKLHLIFTLWGVRQSTFLR